MTKNHTNRKLQLSRETVRSLDHANLRAVAGGTLTVTTFCPIETYACQIPVGTGMIERIGPNTTVPTKCIPGGC